MLKLCERNSPTSMKISLPSRRQPSPWKGCFSILAAVACLTLTSGIASTVTSDVAGFSKVVGSPGGRIVSPVLANPVVFQAPASVTNGTFAVTGLTNSLSATSYTDRPNAPVYYLEIAPGSSFEGMRYDILSNSSTSITVAGNASALNGQTNLIICIRKHITLGDLAGASAGLTDYNDAFTLYRSNNVKSSFYYTSAGVLCDDYMTPGGQAVVAPGTAVILNSMGSATFTFSGTVKGNRTLATLFPGENLVAPQDPVGGMKVTGQNIAPSLQSSSDTATLFSVDGRFVGYRYYSDGVNLLDMSRNILSTNSAPAVPVGAGFVITSSSGGTWTNASVITN